MNCIDIAFHGTFYNQNGTGETDFHISFKAIFLQK